MTTETSLYRQTLQTRTDLYNKAIADGEYRPFIYPWDSLSALFLILGVALSPQFPSPINRITRWGFAIAAFWYCFRHQYEVRTLGLTSGYGIGLSAIWGLIMTVVLLVLHDPGRDFERIELRQAVNGDRIMASSNDSALSQSTSSDRHASSKVRERVVYDMDKRLPAHHTDQKREGQNYTLVWQGYPRGLWHLADWTGDLITAFRGRNWNFRPHLSTQAIPCPEGDPPTLPHEVQKQSIQMMRKTQREAVKVSLFWYIALDLVKTVVVTEPFFLGIASIDSSTTWTWLENLNRSIPFATRFVRLMLSLASVVTALSFIFSLNPLFFCLVLPWLLGDKLLIVTRSPLLEGWMYPPQWGPMFQTICNKGLAGMWGQWWHQMFRYGISEPSKLLIEKLGLQPRGQLSRVLQVMIAFTLTGIIHAAASSTTFSIIPGRPLHPFLFFFGQGVGILIQTAVSKQLNHALGFSTSMRRAGNFAFTFLWLWYTGPLLANDFSRCGIWLFEPVPISFFRGLGFGPGDCWFPWFTPPEGGRTIWWWRGDRWYRTGFAIY